MAWAPCLPQPPPASCLPVSTAANSPAPAAATSNPVKRLYDWVLHWAETPYGVPVLGCLAFIESVFFPVPPDVLLIALVLGSRARWFRLALVCSLASVVGGLVGYSVGYALWGAVSSLFFSYVPGFSPARFERVQALYEQWNFWIVFTAGFTPIPYKLITVSAGVFKVNVVMFAIASAVSRSARFFLVAWLLQRYGAPIKDFIDRRFNLLAMVFTVLLVGGFAVLKYAM